MKKGLTQTLMAVAVITMAIRVMAMAPTILDIPSPVVGDKEDTTPGNTFVFPDAIDLKTWVTDDFTTPGAIIWSFKTKDGSASHYAINGADALGTGDDIVNPPVANLIAGTDTLGSAADSDDAKVDADAYTITIRNIILSPVGGPNVDPGAAGVVAGETQVVTLFASDGTTASTTGHDITIYTANEENDGMSNAPEYHEHFTDPAAAHWRYSAISGAVTSSSPTSKVCLQTVQAGDNSGEWIGPYGMLELVKNSIYRIRVKMTDTQTGANEVPLWDLTVNNYGYDANMAAHGLNLYGMNYMVFDNTGDANAFTDGQPKTFDVWWCPSALGTTQWNDETDTGQAGPWAPSNAGNKDAFIEFRVLDAASNGTLHQNQAFGTLCLDEISIDRYDFAAIQDAAAETNLSLVQGTSGVSANTKLGCAETFAAGSVTITPSAPSGGLGSGSANAMLGEITPGDLTFDTTYQNSGPCVDNFPITMDPHSLYLITYELSAPTSGDAAAPVDIIWLGADTLTNELTYLSWVAPTNAWHHAAPTTTPQNYYALFASNYGTASTNASWFSRLRPRFMFGSNQGLGGGGEANSGGVKITAIKVKKITVSGAN